MVAWNELQMRAQTPFVYMFPRIEPSLYVRETTSPCSSKPDLFGNNETFRCDRRGPDFLLWRPVLHALIYYWLQ